MLSSEGSRILLSGVSKRYIKYDDTPLLLSRALGWNRTRRSELWALRDVDLAVAPGEFVGVIGQNGAGKSTLLRLLAGVTAPTVGRLTVHGRVAPLLSVGVGFHPELTGRENVYLNGIIVGLVRREIDERFDEIVAFAEVAEFIDTPVKFYSSGMFMRLGFAVSILADPDVLIIDEILAVGDIAFQVKCFERMRQIREAGTTLVLVTHNLRAVQEMCDRAIVLHRGAVQHDGDTGEGVGLLHRLLEQEQHVTATVDGSPFEEREISRSATVELLELRTEAGVPTAYVRTGERMVLTLRARFNVAVADAMIGVIVSSAEGVVVYWDTTPSTSTYEFAAGDVVEVDLPMKVVLAGGSYNAEVAIADTRERMLARAAAPLSFFVDGRADVHGLVDLDGAFDVRVEAKSQQQL